MFTVTEKALGALSEYFKDKEGEHCVRVFLNAGG